MKTLIAIFLLNAILMHVKAGNIRDCTPSASPVEVKSVSVYPDPVEVGRELQISLEMRTDKKIERGQIDIKTHLKIGDVWQPLPPMSRDLCSIIDCPIEEGSYDIHEYFMVPSILPRGDYRGNVGVRDNELLICLDFNMTLV